MNLTGIMWLFIILAIATVFIIVPWYTNTVASDTTVATAVTHLKVPSFATWHPNTGFMGTIESTISLPIAVVNFVFDYTGYINTVLHIGAPGFAGWMMMLWYAMIGLLSATTIYVIYTIIAARSG